MLSEKRKREMQEVEQKREEINSKRKLRKDVLGDESLFRAKERGD